MRLAAQVNDRLFYRMFQETEDGHNDSDEAENAYNPTYNADEPLQDSERHKAAEEGEEPSADSTDDQENHDGNYEILNGLNGVDLVQHVF